MSFDLLFWVSLAIAALCLVRVRPATFIFAGNQLGVLRALANIERFGQPRSQAFLPQSVFSLENLAIARRPFDIYAAEVVWDGGWRPVLVSAVGGIVAGHAAVGGS